MRKGEMTRHTQGAKASSKEGPTGKGDNGPTKKKEENRFS